MPAYPIPKSFMEVTSASEALQRKSTAESLSTPFRGSPNNAISIVKRGQQQFPTDLHQNGAGRARLLACALVVFPSVYS
nr:hypothetical protein CFP56_16240 [Quercus suber]